MKRSLHVKLSVIMLLVILLFNLVISAFLVRGVQSFYLEEFYAQMRNFFGDPEIASQLQNATDTPDQTTYESLGSWLDIYSGRLGLQYGRRQYFVLDGQTGTFLVGSELPPQGVAMITPNVLRALSGTPGYQATRRADFMDVALPIETAGGTYIIQIFDTKATAAALSGNLFTIIWQTALFGLLVSILLSFLLSKAMVVPIQSLTAAADRIAAGDFSSAVDVTVDDEIGELAQTFHNMADRLQETMEQLEDAAAKQKEFVANVSHELRTPLTSVRSYAETLSASPNLPANKRHDLLRVVMDESDRMTKIVQDLLTLAQLDGKKNDLPMETFSYKAAVERVCRTVALTAEEKQLQVTLHSPENPTAMVSYRPDVEQIVLNIVSNAVKYTQPGGTITLTAEESGPTLALTIADNGPGIPEEDLPRIFERFYRVDKGRSRALGGTGLGLGLAREMAERAGGEITITSTLGIGTTVTIHLPLEDIRYDPAE